MVFINKQGKVVYANERCEEIMGYQGEELYAPGFDFLSLVAPESRELARSRFVKHMKGEEIKPYEHVLMAKDGHRIVTLSNTRLIDYEGEKAVLGIETDSVDGSLSAP